MESISKRLEADPMVGNYNEENNRKLGYAVSIILHILLFLLFIFYPFFVSLDPPPQMQGVLVNFGTEVPENNEDSSDQLPVGETLEPVVEDSQDDDTPVKQPESKPVETQVKTPPVESETTSKDKPETVKSELATNEAAIQASKVKAAQKAAKALANQKAAEIQAAKDAEEAEAKEQARLAAEQRKQEEAYKNAKSKFGSMFGSGNKKPSKGDPTGKPNSEILSGLSKGAGKVGGGLKDRGVVHVPQFKDNSQKEGRIVLKVCVDKSGKVISAKYTQAGSTSSDLGLIKIAKKNAMKYSFTALDIEEQCGNITIDFKLK